MSFSIWWIVGGVVLVILGFSAWKPSKAARQRRHLDETRQSIKVAKPKGPTRAKQSGLRAPVSMGWEVHKFGDNAPAGDWVQWKIGSGWFDVQGLFNRKEKVREFLRLAAQADVRGEPFGALLNPEPDNKHDKNAMQVIGILGPHEAPTSRVFLGYVPAEVAAEVASFPEGMAVAVELKKSRIGEVDVILNCAGLWPPAKQRRELGFEKAPSKPVTRVDENALEKLDALIERMNAMPALAAKQAAAKAENEQDRFYRGRRGYNSAQVGRTGGRQITFGSRGPQRHQTIRQRPRQAGRDRQRGTRWMGSLRHDTRALLLLPDCCDPFEAKRS